MPELSQEIFDVIAGLIRSRDPVRTAAMLVLVKGKSNQEAIKATGVSAASVSNTLTRFRQANDKIKKAYKALEIHV